MGLFDSLTGGDNEAGDGGPAGDRKPDGGDPEAPVSVAVDSVLSIAGPAVVTGRVERGTVRPGDRLAVPGDDVVGQVVTVEHNHQAVDAAEPGAFVGLELEAVDSGELRGVDRLREP